MALREIFAHFGFAYDKAKLAEINRGVEGVKKSAKDAGGSGGLGAFVSGLQGLAAVVAGNALFQFTQQIKTQAADLQDLSDQTGLATDELQAWTLAAQLGGASAADFTGGLRKLSRELATGVDESGQQSKLFKTLGIAAKDGEGNVRDLSSVLPEIADKFASLQTGAERSALAQQIFGRAGTKLVPILSKGAAGVAELRQRFEELGGGFSKEAIAAADQYDDALIKLQFSFFGLKSLLATSVFPALSNIVEKITKASVGATKWVKETTLLSNGIKVLAGVLTGKLLLALAPFLLPGLKFAAIFLAVDDLIAFLEGKESVIGDILDRWFGDGTAAVVQGWCASAKDAIVGTFIGALDLLKIALAKTDAEQQTLWQHFELATRPVERAIDAIIEKVALLKDIFSLDVINQGLEDAFDLLDSGVSSLTGQETHRENRIRMRKELAAERDRKQAAANPPAPFDPRSAFSPDMQTDVPREPPRFNARLAFRGVPTDPQQPLPASPSAVATAPITNNISPISVAQTFQQGTPTEVRKAAEAGSRAGVEAGLSAYRTALQNLEQRSSAK